MFGRLEAGVGGGCVRRVVGVVVLVAGLLGGCSAEPAQVVVPVTGWEAGEELGWEVPDLTLQQDAGEEPDLGLHALDLGDEVDQSEAADLGGAVDMGAAQVDMAAPPRVDMGGTVQPPVIKQLRVMTYNIKRGSVTSIERIAQVIKRQDPDLVGLQEVFEGSGSNTRSNATRLGNLLGMHSAFRQAKAVSGGHTGLAVLSKYPIVSVKRVALTSGSEQRILLIARVKLPDGTIVTLADTHFGLSVDERQAQAREVKAAMQGRPLATLVGDFNSYATGAVHITLRELLRDTWQEAGSGPGDTSPAGNPKNRIDYIYRSRDWRRAQNARVIDTQASDHRPVVVEVVRK